MRDHLLTLELIKNNREVKLSVNKCLLTKKKKIIPIPLLYISYDNMSEYMQVKLSSVLVIVKT